MKYRCACKTQKCKMTLEPAYGVTPDTVTLGIRQHNATLMQAYLTYRQALSLAGELKAMVRKARQKKAEQGELV
jgi:hypothetical protein